MRRARKKTNYSSFAEKSRPVLLVVSGLMLVIITACYWTQHDSVAGMTVWPVWVWALPGFLAAEYGWSKRRWLLTLLLSIAWLAVVTGFGDARGFLNNKEWPSEEWQIAKDHNDAIRVVTVNCGAGNDKAAAEVDEYTPDIVLFQESPAKQCVSSIARKLYKHKAAVVWTNDTAIIARGRILSSQNKDSWLTESRIRLTTGREVVVMDVHLSPVAFRTDVWKSEYWKYMSHMRRVHRHEMEYVKERIDQLADSAPVILGGDFNSPAGDAIFHAISPKLRDAFRDGGKGWGCTLPNSIPLIRIDQVWTNDHFYAAAVIAERTDDSDHRMVICDLLMRAGN
ncbi:MAG: endonuclease/exonuclease/phosphatase family protein [Armatimonadota bacterium]